MLIRMVPRSLRLVPISIDMELGVFLCISKNGNVLNYKKEAIVLKKIYVKDVATLEDGVEVEVKGWVHKIYDLGKISFVRLRDKSGIIQVVLDKEHRVKLRLEMCIAVKGKKASNPKAPNGIEVQGEKVEILGKAYYDILPFEINSGKIEATLETQLDHRAISLRAPKIMSVFKIQEKIADAFKDYLKGENFTEIYTPKILAEGTEGGSELFTVNYFDHRAFLAQSPQFYKQMMVGSGFERVFEVGHAYRAELHNTYRHLNEYVSLRCRNGFYRR